MVRESCGHPSNKRGKDKDRRKKPIEVNEEQQIKETETKYSQLFPKSENQAKYWKSLNTNTITIASGPSGCAKTLFALRYGFELIAHRYIEKIIYIKPNVGMKWERDIGALPGDAKEKMNPLIRPVLDNLSVFMPVHQAKYYIDKGVVEAMLLSDCRGVTFNNCLAILDESQNVPPAGIKAFLTRCGRDSRGNDTKMVLAGDPNQCDVAGLFTNGISDAMDRLEGVKNVGIIRFTKKDSFRSEIIRDILDKYERV
jgi:phosphate starvation-inducible protein PhoH and related proteins